MDFYMHHGRTDPDGPPQSKVVSEHGAPEYYDIDAWGFEGPRLKGLIGFHYTYGVGGYFNLWFTDERAANEAAKMTGWDNWGNHALTVRFSDDNSLVMIRDAATGRAEYFGDGGLI